MLTFYLPYTTLAQMLTFLFYDKKFTILVTLIEILNLLCTNKLSYEYEIRKLKSSSKKLSTTNYQQNIIYSTCKYAFYK